MLKQQHLGFGPKKHAGINSSERRQSYVGRSCRNWEIIGKKIRVCVCVCTGEGKMKSDLVLVFLVVLP